MIVRFVVYVSIFEVVDTYTFLKLKYATAYFKRVMLYSHDCANEIYAAPSE